MTGNPTTETFQARLNLSLPAAWTSLGQYQGLVYIPPGTYDIPAILNSFGPGVYDVALLGVLMQVPPFQGVLPSPVNVSGSHWEAKDGKCVLVCNLTVTSDPLTAEDLVVIITGAALLLTAALIALWVASGGGTFTLPGAIILAALAISGTLVILTVLITKGAEALSNPLVFIFALVALGVGGYVAYEYFKGPKRRATAYTPRRRVATRRRSK
jgi:hypothetical protein